MTRIEIENLRDTIRRGYKITPCDYDSYEQQLMRDLETNYIIKEEFEQELHEHYEELENTRKKATDYIKELLVPNRICNRCLQPVLKSTTNGYKYQCMYCDEDLLEIETAERKTKITKENMNDFIEIVEGWF